MLTEIVKKLTAVEKLEEVKKLEEVWPEVYRRALAALRHKGVRLEPAEDAVLEAETRALAKHVPFEDADDLLRWIHVVAWRVALDVRRHERRVVHAIPDRASTDDTENEIEARSRLAAVRKLLLTLTPIQRDALWPRTRRVTDRREAVRLAVRRHRIRARLLAKLEGTGAVVGGWRYRRILRLATRKVAVAVAAPLVAVLSIAAALPYLRDVPPAPTPAQGAAFVEPRPSADHPSPSLSPATTVPARNRDPALPPPTSLLPSPVPAFELTLPSPTGRGEMRVRPPGPDDPVVCLDLVIVGNRCAELPAPVNP